MSTGGSRGVATPRLLSMMTRAMTPTRPRSGTLLVAGMIAFGLALTGVLYAYAWLHGAPFRPLAAALAARFPESAPRVDGGKPRLDRPGDAVLRIVLRVGFDPNRDGERAEAFAAEFADFLRTRPEPARFDLVELHLFRPTASGEPSLRSFHMRTRGGAGRRMTRINDDESAP